MEGNLKWHSGTGKWKDQWFVLQGQPPQQQQQLAYYPARPTRAGGGGAQPSTSSSPSSTSAPQGVVSLAGLHKVIPATGPADVPAWKDEFQGRCVVLESDDAKHYLVAENRREMVRWLKELTAIKNAQRRNGLLAAASAAVSADAAAAATTTTKTTNASGPAWTASTPEGQSDNRGGGGRSGTARNKRQALVLGKGFKPLASLQDAVATTQPESAQGTPETTNDPPATQEPVSDEALDIKQPSETTRQESDMSSTNTKLQQLEERRKRVSMRTAPMAAAMPTADPASDMKPQEDAASTSAISSTDSAAQRLREMELRAEERRKKAEELAAKRKTALQALNGGANGVTSSANATAKVDAEPKEEPSISQPADEEAMPRSSALDDWKSKKIAEEAAQGQVKKLLVGELEARIASKVKVAIGQKRQSMNVAKELQSATDAQNTRAQAESIADNNDADDNSTSPSVSQEGEPEVEKTNSLVSQEEQSPPMQESDQPKQAQLEEQGDSKPEQGPEHAAEPDSSGGETNTIKEPDVPQEAIPSPTIESKQDQSITAASPAAQDSDEKGSLLAVALTSKPSASALVHMTRDRPVPVADRKRPTSRRRTKAPSTSAASTAALATAQSPPSGESTDESNAAQTDESVPELRDERANDMSTVEAAQEEPARPAESQEEVQQRSDAETKQNVEDIRQNNDPDDNKGLAENEPIEADSSTKPSGIVSDGETLPQKPLPETNEEEKREQGDVPAKIDDERDTLQVPVTKKRSDSDVELAQRVEEIELKKRQMLERMRQREQGKSRLASLGRGATNLKAEITITESPPDEPPKELSDSPEESRKSEQSTKRDSWRASKPKSSTLSKEDAEQLRQKRASWFAKQAQDSITDQPTVGAGVMEHDQDSQKEAMRQMLAMLAKQKAERAEERERLKKMLDERKKKRADEYESIIRESNEGSPEEVRPVEATEEERKKKLSEDELKKIKEEMRKIRSTIILIDQESASINERMAQMRVEELQERRESERRAAEEQGRLEREMREKLKIEKALEILLLRYVPLRTPREVREHEQHILEKTTQNAVLINLSGILLGRGRSHGNWFAHKLGRTDITPTTKPVEEIDEETIVRLKGGIIVRKPHNDSEWQILALPENCLMSLESESENDMPPSAREAKADDEDVSLEDDEHTDNQEEQKGGDVAKVFISLTEDLSGLEDLAPEKQELLSNLREAVGKIIEHFSSSTLGSQGPLGDETTDRHITRLVRGNLSTVLADILSVGFKSWKFFGSYHLWDYLEAYGQQSDSVSDLAALALRNAIKNLNSNARMIENPNVKFRALICQGLNNKYLDQWVSLLIGRKSLNEKWFNEESLIRHPGASDVIVKSLRRLSRLTFTMDINYEVRPVVSASTRPRGSLSDSPQNETIARQQAASSGSDGADEAEEGEMRMRLRGLSNASAARAAAAATAAVHVFAASEKTNSMAATSEGDSSGARTTKGGVKLWGSLWSDDSGSDKTSEDATDEQVSSESKRSSSLDWGALLRKSATNLNSSISNSIESFKESKKKEEKRRGKERIRGSDDFDDDEIKVERMDDMKIEIQEIGNEQGRSSGGNFFSSFIGLAKSIVESDDDDGHSDEEERRKSDNIFDDESLVIFTPTSSQRQLSRSRAAEEENGERRSGGSWWDDQEDNNMVIFLVYDSAISSRAIPSSAGSCLAAERRKERHRSESMPIVAQYLFHFTCSSGAAPRWYLNNERSQLHEVAMRHRFSQDGRTKVLELELRQRGKIAQAER